MNDFLRHTIEFERQGMGIVLFLAFFSSLVAIFHTFIFSSLFNIKLRPRYLFFLLNPALVIGLSFFHKGLSVLAFVFLFGSVFVLAIPGIIVSGIRSSRETSRQQKAFRQRYNLPEKSRWQRFMSAAGTLVFLALALSIGPAGIILMVIALVVARRIFFPGSKSHFLKLQAILPTSTIQSLAMGLAEIQGRLRMEEPLTAPIDNKPCIGFRYTIEDISTDNDGDDHYSTVFSETKYHPFFIEDATGKIKVLPERLEMVFPEVDSQYTSNRQRYTQYLLLENQEMLLIGQASVDEHNQPVMVYETAREVFAIAPVNAVTRYNKLKPLLNQATVFGALFALMTAAILLMPVDMTGNRITLHPSGLTSGWSSFANFFKHLF